MMYPRIPLVLPRVAPDEMLRRAREYADAMSTRAEPRGGGDRREEELGRAYA